ncbi:MAG: ribosome-associated translation inhibitor RaiA [Acidimicrobiia bacterium]|nr:ribosome-associated translation inhibitor RaiA [Acidimicrobiia bacterium]
MEIVVRHKHGRVSPELRSIAAEKVGRVSRFLRDVARIDVEFDDERNPSVAESDLCEILVHLKGTLLKAHSAASSPEAALDLAIDKMEHQARKLHERRVSRSHPKGSRRSAANGRPSNGSSPNIPEAESGDAPIVRLRRTLRSSA